MKMPNVDRECFTCAYYYEEEDGLTFCTKGGSDVRNN